MPKGVYKRKPFTKECIANMKVAQKKRWEKPEERAKQSTSQKIAQNRPEVKKKKSISMMGDKNPAKRPEVKAKNIASQKRVQKEVQNRPEVVEKKKKAIREAMNRPEVKVKIRGPRPSMQGGKNPMKKAEVIRKQIRACGTKPNKPERFLDKLFQRLLPNQIKYTGDGKDEDSIVAGKCPDFMFTDGQKKIIEHFGDWWHGEKKTGIPNKQHEQERIDLFAKEGYQTLVIWEYELDDLVKLVKKVSDFTNG